MIKELKKLAEMLDRGGKFEQADVLDNLSMKYAVLADDEEFDLDDEEFEKYLDDEEFDLDDEEFEKYMEDVDLLISGKMTPESFENTHGRLPSEFTGIEDPSYTDLSDQELEDIIRNLRAETSEEDMGLQYEQSNTKSYEGFTEDLEEPYYGSRELKMEDLHRGSGKDLFPASIDEGLAEGMSEERRQELLGEILNVGRSIHKANPARVDRGHLDIAEARNIMGEFCKLANMLDEEGMYEEADLITNIMRSFSSK